MARICIDARGAIVARGTGIGNYTHQLISWLSRFHTNHEYHLLWPDDGTPPLELPPNFRFHPLTRKRRDEATQLPQWLEKQGIELYHAPDNGLHTFICDSVRLVVTIHDLIPFVMPETVRRSFRRNFLERVPQVAQRAQSIITVSQRAKTDIMDILGISQDKIQVIYPAPEQVFTQTKPRRTVTFVHFRYDISTPYILYAGGLNPRKNVGELIFAFAKARKYWGQEYFLIVVGEMGKDCQDLSALCRGLGIEGKVIFPGFVPLGDLAALYQGASLFVYPSLYEGSGLPPVEAMASGVPVVASPVPSVMEAVPGASLLFDPEDTTALVAQLDRGLQDQRLRDAMQGKGYSAVAQLCWENTAAQTLAVYHRVLAL